MIREQLFCPTVILESSYNLRLDYFQGLWETLSRLQKALRETGPPGFDSVEIDVVPCGAARAASVFEANPDAARLWAIPGKLLEGPVVVRWPDVPARD